MTQSPYLWSRHWIYGRNVRWKVANDQSEKARKIREFLVLLSGKLIERGTEFTHPALLSGLWTYLQIMDIITLFDRDELFEIKRKLTKIMGFEV